MTAHELAKRLLELPDDKVRVLTGSDMIWDEVTNIIHVDSIGVIFLYSQMDGIS